MKGHTLKKVEQDHVPSITINVKPFKAPEELTEDQEFLEIKPNLLDDHESPNDSDQDLDQEQSDIDSTDSDSEETQV